MSDFLLGILSEIRLFSYTFWLRSHTFNIFFLEYALPDLPEGVNKAPQPANQYIFLQKTRVSRRTLCPTPLCFHAYSRINLHF